MRENEYNAVEVRELSHADERATEKFARQAKRDRQSYDRNAHWDAHGRTSQKQRRTQT